ncbi:malto-oligosyltrehalose synthase [Nitratireductor luteus]|uniref:malto-oligosyltrehalose synthase n=1 Tax=Nitratireductor luteus TaxID=2976980 RepID=UPI0022409F77|nr:malto-oligosyltrehalose synthase [Nitratireductor luteus]
MNSPRATYRLQFREGMTFMRASQIVPYLADLGISHLYASPIFAAAPGSTHGYDVTDHQALDPSLGGEAGFAALTESLRKHGLGLILDIVPNHMAASTANPWWRDVLKYGRESRYARHFDINWRALKLLLPVLGEPYGQALAGGRLQLGLDDESGEPVLRYYELALPLCPASVDILLNGSSGEALGADTLKQAVEKANADSNILHRIHEAQVWRLAYWRLAREALTYRRFFEIADLVGVRVEDRAVFADVHKLPLRLVREGLVDGLRIDHVDGLADPAAYLDALKRASGLDYVLVEKILDAQEELRADWRCAGTTGYEVARLITALQVDPAERQAMTEAWIGFTGGEADFSRQVRAAKRRILTVNLAGELAALVRLAHAIAQGDTATRDFGPEALRQAIVELAVALPVYRTYIGRNGPTAEDRDLIARATDQVVRDRVVEDDLVIGFVASLLREPSKGLRGRAAFVTRFQQTTGPLMAKAVEDTVFYRYNRLIALNEVGAEPDEYGLEPDAFHAAVSLRAAAWPHALSATVTHDTKRGEDGRARLAVLSEMPETWKAAVSRWHEAAAELREELPLGPAPSAGAEWLFYQALAGAWPSDLVLEDETGLQDLCERLVSFMTKALREAKRRTSWTDQNERYETAVENYVRTLFSPEHRPLLANIHATIEAIQPAGTVNSLAQLTLKLTLPGVPDVYQGCELMDFSMVDPDNRRPVDFALRQKLLRDVRGMFAAEAMGHWREGLPKFWLLERLLRLRREHAPLFENGSYSPVAVTGDRAGHVLAFSRTLGTHSVVVAVPRLVLGIVRQDASMSDVFSSTRLRLPESKEWKDIFSGLLLLKDEPLLSECWSTVPVAVLDGR